MESMAGMEDTTKKNHHLDTSRGSAPRWLRFLCCSRGSRACGGKAIAVDKKLIARPRCRYFTSVLGRSAAFPSRIPRAMLASPSADIISATCRGPVAAIALICNQRMHTDIADEIAIVYVMSAWCPHESLSTCPRQPTL